MQVSCVAAVDPPPADATAVVIRAEFDNKVDEVKDSIKKTQENFKKSLCNVPGTNVKIIDVIDESNAYNIETVVRTGAGLMDHGLSGRMPE